MADTSTPSQDVVIVRLPALPSQRVHPLMHACLVNLKRRRQKKEVVLGGLEETYPDDHGPHVPYMHGGTHR